MSFSVPRTTVVEANHLPVSSFKSSKKNGNRRRSNRRFPFTHVVITFPDKAAAMSADAGPIQNVRAAYPDCSFFASTDPFGARVGSGGGTLAALQLCRAAASEEQNQQHKEGLTALILHAGGDSSRCPVSMVQGKAWTSFPSVSGLQTPIDHWLSLADKLFQGVPAGTVVVVASDTFLQLNGNTAGSSPTAMTTTNPYIQTEEGKEGTVMIDWDAISHNTVLGLAVPAPLETAKNHGVFVLNGVEDENVSTSNSKRLLDGEQQQPLHFSRRQKSVAICPCDRILQKPNVQTLLQSNNSFNLDDEEEKGGSSRTNASRVAWIDTGVIVFLPTAAHALDQLYSDTELSACTVQGLQQLWQQQNSSSKFNNKNSSKNSTISIEEFAQTAALKVDLYTHLLRAMSLDGKGDRGSSHRRLAAYCAENADLSTVSAQSIFSALNPLFFQVLACKAGRFLHTGTTKELLQFLEEGCNNSNDHHGTANAAIITATAPVHPRRRQAKLCRDIGREMHLVNRLEAVTLCREQKLKPHKNTFNGEVNHQNGCHQGHCDQNQKTHQDVPCNEIDPTAVIYHSILQADNILRVQAGSVVEHSIFTDYTEINIGMNSMVSGVRAVKTASTNDGSPTSVIYPPPTIRSSSFVVPDGLLVQQLTLGSSFVKENDDNTKSSFVYMVLGVEDGIKSKTAQIYGKPFHEFLDFTGLLESDLWDGDSDEKSNHTLWTAKLHPVVAVRGQVFSFEDLYSWLVPFCGRGSDVDRNSSCAASLQRWKLARRISLTEIRNGADATAEFDFHRSIIHDEIPLIKERFYLDVKQILCNRRHDPIDLQFLVDLYRAASNTSFGGSADDSWHDCVALTEVLQALQVLDSAIHAGLNAHKYDVCGRAFMVASSFLEDLMLATMNSAFASVLAQSATSLFFSTVQWLARQPLLCAGRLKTTLKGFQKNHRSLACGIKDDNIPLSDPCQQLKCLSTDLESLAQRMTEICVCITPERPRKSSEVEKITDERSAAIYDTWVMATAPARVDLAGGWSDTPPVCYEYGATVTGAAVLIDNKFPLCSRCRIVTNNGNDANDKGAILLRTEIRDSKSGHLQSAIESEVRTLQDLSDYCNPRSDCALQKCALVCLGMISVAELDGADNSDGLLQPFLNTFCQKQKGDNVRLEVVVTSLLPQGSGLGTSSILGGCVLAAVSKCAGINLASSNDNTKLVNAVSMLEQRLTTAGGFQDQVNGLIGGFKQVSCEPCQFPLKLSIEKLSMNSSSLRNLNDRLILVFTGKTRLAKNILQSVLRRWARRGPEILNTVDSLQRCAHASTEAIGAGDLDALGNLLSEYWFLKKKMAGPESGAEPELIREVLSVLQDHSIIRGASLCGAGGGGFMAMILKDGHTMEYAQALLEQECSRHKNSLARFAWHDCKVSLDGLTSSVQTAVITGRDSFDLTWLTPST